DGNRADGHGRVSQNPLARRVYVLAGGQVHHGVRAPPDRPTHLLDLLLNRRGDGRVADVRVYLDEEVAADCHRFRLGVVDVGRNDRASARDFGAYELGRDELRYRSAETLAAMLMEERASVVARV